MRNGSKTPLFRLRATVSCTLAAMLSMGLAACSTLPAKVAPQTTALTKPAPVPATNATAAAPLPQDANGQPGDTASTETVTVFPNLDEQDLGQVDMDPVQLSAEDLAKFGDVWERMRHGFKLDLTQDNDRIAAQRNWYIQRQDYLDRMSARASRYLFHTVTEAEKRSLPTELALLPVIESSYDPFAYSRAQASGMWQLIPGTAKILGVKQNWWYDGRRDVVDSTRAAYDFLSKLHDKFGSWELALAAYNAGPGTVARAIERNQAAGLPTDFWSLRLPAETMSYVPRFIAVAQLINSPEKYGVAIKPVVNQPHFRAVALQGQVDLAKAAELAGITLKELYQLNPAYNHWATDPDGPHSLLVPASTAADFEEKLAALPAPERVVVQHYKVKKGDNLFRIASRFDLSAAELKRLNHLKGNHLKHGQLLVVTKASAEKEAYALSQEQRLAQLQNVAVVDKDRKHYKVKRGDTIYAVARKNHVNPKDLARWNGLALRDHLRPGQTISILVSSKAVASASKGSRSSRAQQDDDNLKRIRYEVKRGDTLKKIASRYKVSVNQIKNWNSGSHHIKPGQGLTLYVASNTRSRHGGDL